MKLTIRLAIICLMPILMVSCATMTPEQNQTQMDDLNMYMLSHGHNIPNHE